MAKSDKTVVVFHMHSCHACTDYLPRFRRVAVKYRPFVAIKQVLATSGNVGVLDKYKIRAFPTTVILDASEKLIRRVEGSLPVREIEEIFEKAARV
jgi:hypothetical protein